MTMKKQYTRKQIVEAINYWKKQIRLGNYKKLNENNQSYKGTLGGYKWIFIVQGDIDSHTSIKSFDSKNEALNYIFNEDIVFDDPTILHQPNSTKYFETLEQAKQYFNTTGKIESSDTEANYWYSLIKVKASDMPKICNLITTATSRSGDGGLEKFDGYNFDFDALSPEPDELGDQIKKYAC